MNERALYYQRIPNNLPRNLDKIFKKYVKILKYVNKQDKIPLATRPRRMDSLSSIAELHRGGEGSKRRKFVRDPENWLSSSSLRPLDLYWTKVKSQESLRNDRAISRATGIKPSSLSYQHSVRSNSSHDMER